MQLSFSAQDINELFAEWNQQTGTALRSDDFETILDLPPRIGQGWIHQIKLCLGLELTLKNIASSEPLVLKLQNDLHWSMLEFTYLYFAIALPKNRDRPLPPKLSDRSALPSRRESLLTSFARCNCAIALLLGVIGLNCTFRFRYICCG